MKKIERVLEIIPGALVWGTFALAVILSVTQPVSVMIFIILFDLYWLLRVLYFVVFLLSGWRRYVHARRVDWQRSLERDFPSWRSTMHLVFLPVYREDFSIVDATLQSLLDAHYPSDRFIVVLAGESRAADHFRPLGDAIKKKYGSAFHRLLITEHPDGIAGEIKSKGANIHYAGQRAKELIDELSIPYEMVIVSAFDIDTIAHPDYFSCLTHTYLSQPDPTRCSYQPVVLYNNNIWDSPSPMRLAAFSTTFWLLTELARPDRLFTFSSHSMSFRALVDVGFWDPTIVSEDSRIFLQCFMRYDGDYSVVPLYTPVSMDTVMAGSVWRSLLNLYKQQRRWAWGVEHFPYMAISFARNKKIGLFKKVRLLFNQAEGMYTWATAPVLIFLLGRLPIWLAPEAVRTTVLAQSAPVILEWLLNLSMVGILVIGLLSFYLLPPLHEQKKRYRYLFMAAQWLLMPVTILIFSALPAIDAQTRLMLGRPLGFAVTEKKRKYV
ncbi:glycosyltransferase family 2 protein [Candidatus Uhrbacteria bacterium]|nr:glycosyltransferase family 2 protein [Candidatus Uhrbacteria bacterium]